MCAPYVATGGKKWLKKTNSEQNDIELVSFHYWTRLDELIILVWSNVKNDQFMAIQRWAKSAAQLIGFWALIFWRPKSKIGHDYYVQNSYLH